MGAVCQSCKDDKAAADDLASMEATRVSMEPGDLIMEKAATDEGKNVVAESSAVKGQPGDTPDAEGYAHNLLDKSMLTPPNVGGIDVDTHEENVSLPIIASTMGNQGLVERWNENNPQAAVKEGDHIVKAPERIITSAAMEARTAAVAAAVAKPVEETKAAAAAAAPAQAAKAARVTHAAEMAAATATTTAATTRVEARPRSASKAVQGQKKVSAVAPSPKAKAAAPSSSTSSGSSQPKAFPPKAAAQSAFPPKASPPVARSGAASKAAFPPKAAPAPKSTAKPLRKVDLAELESEDLEVVREALCNALRQNVRNEATQKAEARLRAERQLPDDWDIATYCAGHRLEGASGGRAASAVVAYQEQDQSVVQAVQKLFDTTYRKVYTRDRRGAPIADRFVVQSVQRVYNDQVWREYMAQKTKIQEVTGTSVEPVPDGTQTMNTIEKDKIQAFPQLDESINEAWLFHGTTEQATTGIAENDFRLDLTGSNAGTLYGQGIYLAENASKSDEYGEGPKGPAGEEQMEAGFEAPRPPPGPPPPLFRESYIVVCRSLLGRINYNDEQRPDADALQKSCLGGGYDSVVGDRLKLNGTYRELIVYNDDCVYPEYIVKYERIFFHERFAEIYEAMLRRKKAGRFNGPTDDEKKVLESLWSVFGMPNKGKINKWQLLDLLMVIYQPPLNEAEDLDETFKQWDKNGDGKIDWNEFMDEIVQRVHDGIDCSGPDKFAQIYNDMLQRKRRNQFKGPTPEETNVLQMVWYTYAHDATSIDKMQLLELLKAINQPPQNEHEDLDQTFREIDTKRDGVIDYDEFLQEISQRVKDGIGL